MTAEATKAPEMSAEARLRARALDTLRTHTLEVILEAEEPLRTADVGRLVAERLDLSLNEEELGGLASLVRMVLDSDPLFSQSNRQWDLALRMGRAEGDRRKPVERALEDFIDLLGHPADARPVAVLASAVYGRMADYYEKMLVRMVPTYPQFFQVPGEGVAITRWLLDISSDEPEDVEYDNFDNNGAVEELRQVARGLDGAAGSDPASYARSLVERAGRPVDGRALQFLTWCAFPDTEPRDLFVALCRDRALHLERGPAWVTVEGHREVLEAIRSLAADPETSAEALAATVPAEDEEIGILAPTTVRVSDDDLEQVYEYMAREERTYRLTELLQQVLEAFPGSRTYGGVRDSLFNRMREEDRFQWVGFERFRVRGTVPAEVETVPPGFAFDDEEYLGPDGEELDRLVEPRDWKPGLEEQIQHYLVQDLGDDSTAPAATPAAQLVASPPLHQYVAGTRYLRHADRGFFPAEPEMLQVGITAPDGTRFEVWVNSRLGLIYGLKDWYEANLPWVGGRFTLERSEQADEFRLNYSGETEPLMDIPLPRLQQLIALRGEAATERLPWSEVVSRLLRAHPEGIEFVTLFTELNVVRRARRARLASLLSSQRFFTSIAGQPTVWQYDEKRAAKPKGKKKGGPRRIREYDEDEDEEFEYE